MAEPNVFDRFGQWLHDNIKFYSGDKTTAPPATSEPSQPLTPEQMRGIAYGTLQRYLANPQKSGLLPEDISTAIQILNLVDKQAPDAARIVQVPGGDIVSITIDPKTGQPKAEVVPVPGQQGPTPETKTINGQTYQYDPESKSWKPAPGLPGEPTSIEQIVTQQREALQNELAKLQWEVDNGILLPEAAKLKAQQASAEALAVLQAKLKEQGAQADYARTQPNFEAQQKVSEATLAEQERANRASEGLTAGTQQVGALKQTAAQGMDILNQSFQTGTQTSPALTKLAFRPLEVARNIMQQMVTNGQLDPSMVPDVIGASRQNGAVPAQAPPPAGQIGGAPPPVSAYDRSRSRYPERIAG
ncbi:MAG: hypothetical protein NUW01_14240 [Gemmatimonadaceae bacterium]|nr:hypothetical protein [Gemmatimonadaceae bacterium]